MLHDYRSDQVVIVDVVKVTVVVVEVALIIRVIEDYTGNGEYIFFFR